ncbi:MAG: alpha/beta hydrolase [Pseudomonadota bacterium]
MNGLADLFPGFEARSVDCDGVTISARVGGHGPALLCLHGYPQSHACWHKIAGRLAENHTVVLADLRGYGDSDTPAPDRGHEAYSKRAMGRDMVALMAALGHDRFVVMGHDRGARVAYRLALDTPDAITALIVLDIIPTIEVWDAMRAAAAIRSYHWSFLAQPAPLPETLIAAAPDAYLGATLKSWVRDGDMRVFHPTALAHYHRQFANSEGIAAVCEDYRAGATYDAAVDAQDRAVGRMIDAPTLFVWGSDYLGRGGGDPLEVWRRWCKTITGAAIASGHFLAEENPDALLGEVLPFLDTVQCRNS